MLTAFASISNHFLTNLPSQLLSFFCFGFFNYNSIYALHCERNLSSLSLAVNSFDVAFPQATIVWIAFIFALNAFVLPSSTNVAFRYAWRMRQYFFSIAALDETFPANGCHLHLWRKCCPWCNLLMHLKCLMSHSCRPINTMTFKIRVLFELQCIRNFWLNLLIKTKSSVFPESFF